MGRLCHLPPVAASEAAFVPGRARSHHLLRLENHLVNHDKYICVIYHRDRWVNIYRDKHRGGGSATTSSGLKITWLGVGWKVCNERET